MRAGFEPCIRDISLCVFMLCVNATLFFLFFFYTLWLPHPDSPSSPPGLLPGWRSAAPRCPCSPGRSWCSSAPSYGRARLSSQTAPSRAPAARRAPCCSSSSSSLCAGETLCRVSSKQGPRSFVVLSSLFQSQKIKGCIFSS